MRYNAPMVTQLSAMLKTGAKKRSRSPPTNGIHCGQNVSMRGKYSMSTTLPNMKGA